MELSDWRDIPKEGDILFWVFISMRYFYNFSRGNIAFSAGDPLVLIAKQTINTEHAR